MTKEELNKRLEDKIKESLVIIDTQGGGFDDVFDFFWNEIQQNSYNREYKRI
jgi:hypothetical protein